MDPELAQKLLNFVRSPEHGFDLIATYASRFRLPRDVSIAHPLRVALRLIPDRAAWHLARHFKYHDPHSRSNDVPRLRIEDLLGEPTESEREHARIPHGGWPRGIPKYPHVSPNSTGWQHAVYASERGIAVAYVARNRLYHESDCAARQQREREWQLLTTANAIEVLRGASNR